MGKKTVKFNKSGIVNLPNDKPVVYRIMSESGKTVYTGVVNRGHVRDRLEEHLRRGKDRIPGTMVQIEQLDHISQARKRESNIMEAYGVKPNLSTNKKMLHMELQIPIVYYKQRRVNPSYFN